MFGLLNLVGIPTLKQTGKNLFEEKIKGVKPIEKC